MKAKRSFWIIRLFIFFPGIALLATACLQNNNIALPTSAFLLKNFPQLKINTSLYSPHSFHESSLSVGEKMPSEEMQSKADKAHEEAFSKERYPSATTCGECHPKQFREWSVSQHAYAQMSPVFNAMQATVTKVTNGTNGDFCIRCHNPVGMNLGEKVFMSNIDRHPTAREGVTCIVCHRVNQSYGKISGRLALHEGDLTEVIYGPKGQGDELQKAIDKGGLITDSNKAGRQVHGEVGEFFQLNTSGFCAVCHDVNLVNGFRLEEAFSEFKNSPAAAKGVSCQDCHMGKIQGKLAVPKGHPNFLKENYDFGPAAVVGTLETAPRKLANHMFSGPDYSVIHPVLFPLNLNAIKEESEKNDPKARGLATIREWLEFDWKAGWGTDDFEDEVEDDYEFPERWESVDDRYDAREIVEENLELLEFAKEKRLEVLRNGFEIGDIVTEQADEDGIEFRIEVKNPTDGHAVPTGFDAERLFWLYVRVFDKDEKLIYESGDLDPNGDLRDLHSLYVHNHELPIDEDLFSLQSKFLTRNLVGGEREQVLPVAYSLTPLLYVRPERRSSTLLGRPGGARKHKQGIEPLGHRWADYSIDKDQLTGAGPYKVKIQFKAAMIPVNLMNTIKDAGFDYNMSPRDIGKALVEGHLVLWEREHVIDLSQED